MKALLLVAVLAFSAFATGMEQIEAIANTELGKTLINTIAVELQNGEPLERLFDLLYEIEDRYIADQKEDDANNRAFQAQCDDDLSGLNNEIAQAEKRSTELQAVLDDLVPLRNQRQAQRNAKAAQKKELQKVMDEATNERQEEADEFEAKRQEFEFVSSVLAEARRLFTDNLQAPSFLQANSNDATHFTPQVMVQVASHLKEGAHKMKDMTHVKSYAQAVKLLATLASRTNQQANQELVGRVVHLIDDLQNQLNQAFDLERKAEDDRQRAFQAYMTLLNKDMNKYNADIANLDAEIASLQDRIDNTTHTQNDVEERKAAKTQQRDDRRAECDEAAYDYQERRSARDGDRQTVSDLIGVLNSNLRDLKQYIALRLAAGDDLS